MKTVKTLIAASAIAVAGSAATAGGLGPVIDNKTIIQPQPTAPTGSINSGYIVLGLLAALVAASGSF